MNSSDIEAVKSWLGHGSINIFGRPFAGKDTVCAKLAEAVDGVVLGGGDILRNTNVPEHVTKVIDAGGLAPTGEYVAIVLPYFSKVEFSKRPLILSSVGRWVGEENGVLRAAEESGHPVKAVIYLDISDEVGHKRWQTAQLSNARGGRSDDQSGKLEKRFDEFNKKTLPVIEAYENKNLLIRIDGSKPPEAVFEEVVVALANLAKPSH